MTLVHKSKNESLLAVSTDLGSIVMDAVQRKEGELRLLGLRVMGIIFAKQPKILFYSDENTKKVVFNNIIYTRFTQYCLL